MTGSYDPQQDLVFWGTGNPAPWNPLNRKGDNLYTNTLLALDADTGKLNWHFQFTKHDEHDWDATQVPVMLDTSGKHLIAQANRNGFFYVVDRTNGKLILANAGIILSVALRLYCGSHPRRGAAFARDADDTLV